MTEKLTIHIVDLPEGMLAEALKYANAMSGHSVDTEVKEITISPYIDPTRVIEVLSKSLTVHAKQLKLNKNDRSSV